MSFDEFDKLIREAADNHHPPYNEGGWNKMRKLLDKHLPQKRDGRRLLFFLLFFLFLSGGIYLALQYLPQGRKKITDNNNTISEKSTQPAETSEKKDESKSNSPGGNAQQSAKPAGLSTEGKEINNADGEIAFKDQIPESSPTAVRTGVKRPEQKNEQKQAAQRKRLAQKTVVKRGKETAVEYTDKITTKKDQNKKSELQAENKIPEEKKTIIIDPVADASVKNDDDKVNTEIQKKDTEEEPLSHAADSSAVKTQEATDTKTPETGKQKNKGILKNVFFTVSAGPDVSAVGLNAGKVQATYGAGIGYAFSEKFAIRTGFYSARKLYTAEAKDYKASQTFLNYYPNLKSVDADCRVYEIPVVVDYDFANKNKHSWFASAGLSTLLMKKETYGYYYKPTWSPDYMYKKWTINNENKHLFSILNVSGGYTTQISKSFSLRAEPYMKIALSGVGHGKINLNSGGVIFTALIKPFNQNK